MAELYDLVPKDLVKNLEYRVALRKRAARDEGFRNAVIAACKHDVLFFFGALCWLHEPRPRRAPNGRTIGTTLPFIPWCHQESVIEEIDRNLGFCDIGIEKSRGEGMTWISCLFALRDWIFDDMVNVGLVSRNMETADNPKDSASMFWKIDWELKKLPPWLVGEQKRDWTRNIKDHSLVNHRNGSIITAYAATGAVGRGGRYKWFLMDELGSFPRGPDKKAVYSTQHSTDCRLYVSTPEGSDGAYYDVMHEPSNMVKLVLSWEDNPTRNKGLYRLEYVETERRSGPPTRRPTAVPVDPEGNPVPKNYYYDNIELFIRLKDKGFDLQKGLRSPWYDNECDRPGATPQNIAQELDRDYAGSRHLVFRPEFLKAVEDTVKEPVLQCIPDWTNESMELILDASPQGPCEIWCPLDVKGRPPQGQYCFGADVASGLSGGYTSNSTIVGIDLTTNEQVLEFAANNVQPHDFADLCMAVCRLFHGAYLAWEHNGPGAAMTRRVLEAGYPNIYRRTPMWRKGSKRSKEAGWWTDEKSKEALFAEINRSVTDKRVILRSTRLHKEFWQYIRGVGGKIEHALSATTEDYASAGKSHGDRVIALGVCLMASKDRSSVTPVFAAEPEEKVHYGTMAHRMQEWDEEQRKQEDWDDVSNSEIRRTGKAW